METSAINLAEFGGTIAGLLVVGAILKNAFPKFDNKFIPLATLILGVLSYLALSSGWSDPKQWVAALVAAATATGVHSGIKNSLQPRDPSITPSRLAPLLIALSILGTATGCRTLAPGGVYQSDEITYNAELSIVTAKDVITTFVKWEKDNREALRKFPEIKQAADSIRANAKQWFDSAHATYDAYRLDPASENQAALERSILVLRTALNEAVKHMTRASTGK